MVREGVLKHVMQFDDFIECLSLSMVVSLKGFFFSCLDFLCEILFSASELVLIFSLLEDGMGNISKWKDSLLERTALRQSMNLKQFVYGKSTSLATSSKEVQDSGESEETDDDEFFKPKGEGNKVCSAVIGVIVSLIVFLSLRPFSININFRYVVSFNMIYEFFVNLMQFWCILSNSCSFIAAVERRNGYWKCQYG